MMPSGTATKSRPYQPMTDDVRVTRAGSVATITMSRPDDCNRLTPDALAKLEVLAHEFARDDDTHAIIITGLGTTYFSMGILNPVIRASYSKEDVIDIVRLANRSYSAIEALPQIVVAALNGLTRAGGAELSHSRVTFASPRRMQQWLIRKPAGEVFPEPAHPIG